MKIFRFPFSSPARSRPCPPEARLHSTDGVIDLFASALSVDRIAEVCRRFGVHELAVFGSAVRGDMRADSDIDILVEFQANAHVGLIKFASLSDELESLLGHRVDLVTKGGLKPRVRPFVLREAQVVYAA